MKITLLTHTPKPELLIATAAKICYSELPVSDILNSYINVDNYISDLVDRGHTSVLEHASFTFAIEGISRACSHQLVRHRIASYTQKSQRYTDAVGDVVVPTSMESYMEPIISLVTKLYDEARDTGIKAEDARYIAPEATTTSIIVTMNARALLNFFEERLCMRAQWEIREVANEMLNLVDKIAPSIFKHAGPKCKTLGYCTEKKPCGSTPSLQDLLDCYKK